MFDPVKHGHLILPSTIYHLRLRHVAAAVSREHPVDGDTVRDAHLPHHFAGELPELLPVHVVLGRLVELQVHRLLQEVLEVVMQTVAEELWRRAHLFFHDDLVFFVLGLGFSALPRKLTS